MDAETLRAVVEEARALNVKVAAHAQGPQAIRNAVLAGVDSIEHGGLIDRETAELMRERKVVLVPTLARLEARPNAKPRTFANVAEAVRAGVPIVLGTDATVLPHGQNANEFNALIEVGLTPLEAIRAATTRASALLGMRDIGRIERGAFADLVAVDGDPLTDVNALKQPRLVVARGKVVVQR
jgi:imidazolonepropionase-like amidohydrolase